MSNQPHPVLQGSPVEDDTIYELKVFVHELLKRVDRLEKTMLSIDRIDKNLNQIEELEHNRIVEKLEKLEGKGFMEPRIQQKPWRVPSSRF